MRFKRKGRFFTVVHKYSHTYLTNVRFYYIKEMKENFFLKYFKFVIKTGVLYEEQSR